MPSYLLLTVNLLDTSTIHGDWGWLTYPAHGVSDGVGVVSLRGYSLGSWHDTGQKEAEALRSIFIRSRAQKWEAEWIVLSSLAHWHPWGHRASSDTGPRFLSNPPFENLYICALDLRIHSLPSPGPK